MVFVTGLQRREVVVDGTIVTSPQVIAYPGDVRGPLTVSAISSSAGANNIEMTYDSEAAIEAATAVWVAVDAALTAVGTTRGVFEMVSHPTAFRVTRAAGDFAFATQGIRV